ncbi:unnamed protein product [Eruca vesicaria subsp. sativa]|uniref:Uncharacterized protein n=1 Tax=Eruca vesicaria subsp. sativa TaxID=29727 RepID=A0ABC8M355_ERUVS|nr:unnamed protein product [Eruca vesicaria subsp. sativa]
MQCIARVPLSSQGSMTLISKNIKAFINGGEIFHVRSRLNVKETSILVGMKSDENNSVNWYILIKKFCNDEYLLRRVPFPPISGKDALIAAGNRVLVLGDSGFFYVEGGSYKKKVMSKTKAIHYDPITAVIDDKVYVFGGCSSEDALNYVEFLDLSTNEWETIPYLSKTES